MTDPTPRRSLFAVWHWPRWTWAAVLLAMAASYFLTAGAVYAVAAGGWALLEFPCRLKTMAPANEDWGHERHA